MEFGYYSCFLMSVKFKLLCFSIFRKITQRSFFWNFFIFSTYFHWNLIHKYQIIVFLLYIICYSKSIFVFDILNIHPRNKKILYYDCTNYYFEIEEDDDLRHYGKSKEHRPNPIVTMGLFMDADGIPLAFDIFPGNKNEQTTLKPLESKILQDFDCSEFIFCSDAGLGSANNRRFNTLGNRAYIITHSLKKMKKEDRDIALIPVTTGISL